MHVFRLAVCSAALLAFPTQLIAQYGFATGLRFQNISFRNANFSGFTFSGRPAQPTTTQSIRFSTLTFGGFSSAQQTVSTGAGDQQTLSATDLSATGLSAGDVPTTNSSGLDLRHRSQVAGSPRQRRSAPAATSPRRPVSPATLSVRDRHFGTAAPSVRVSRASTASDRPRARYVIR